MAFNVALVHLLFGRGFGVIAVAPYVIQQAVDQIIVESLSAMVDKTQQIDVHHPLIQSLELVDGVVAHQGGVVFNVSST